EEHSLLYCYIVCYLIRIRLAKQWETAMRWKSSADSYGAVAISIHWLTAAAILGVLGTGLSLDRVGEEAEAGVLRVHVVFGITAFALTILRIVWWLFADRRPLEAPD